MLRHMVISDIMASLLRTNALNYSNKVIKLTSTKPGGWMFHRNDFHRCQHQMAHEKNTKSTDNKTPSDASIIDASKVIKKKESFVNFVSSRLLHFLDRYQKLLEKKFPGAMTVYRVFVIGFKDFSIDTKDYLVIKNRIVMSPTKVVELSKKDIDLYYRMPGEILRVGPTLLISALPFANYIVFPIAYYFPKKLLSSHFWSLQQKSQFAQEFHKDKLLNYRPLLRHLQFSLEEIKDEGLKSLAKDVLHDLGSGSHPTVEKIMGITYLFEKERYSLKAIHGPHVKCLCSVHSMNRLYLKRSRLYDRAEMLRSIDIVIRREGISNLKTDELKNACFLRGLNASNLRNEEMLDYLETWMSVSQHVESRANSLLLHLPILISYNHPNNWALLRSK